MHTALGPTTWFASKASTQYLPFQVCVVPSDRLPREMPCEFISCSTSSAQHAQGFFPPKSSDEPPLRIALAARSKLDGTFLGAVRLQAQHDTSCFALGCASSSVTQSCEKKFSWPQRAAPVRAGRSLVQYALFKAHWLWALSNGFRCITLDARSLQGRIYKMYQATSCPAGLRSDNAHAAQQAVLTIDLTKLGAQAPGFSHGVSAVVRA